MDEQLEKSRESKEGLMVDKNSQIEEQAGQLRQQIELFKEQTKAKKEEEQSMAQMLKDYRSKYEEF